MNAPTSTQHSRSAMSVALPPIAPEAEQKPSTREVLARLAAENWIFGVLIVLIVGFSLASGSFFSQANWLNVTNSAVGVCLLAVAQTLLVVAGGIDLSQGAVMGFSGVLAAWIITTMGGYGGAGGGWMTALAFLIAIGIGTLLGLANGLIITMSKLNPFIITLGTFQVCTGLSNLFSNGQDITTLPPQVGQIGNFNIGGWISIPVLVAAVIFLILGVMLRRTRFGKYIYVIGDSEEAALRAGLRVKRHMIILFTLSGAISALAGVMQMARLSDASPTAGQDLMLNSIAAAVIGGTSLAGGRGTVGRTIIGGLIISILLIGLVIADVQPYWQQVAIGTVLVIAVFIDEKGRVGSTLKRRLRLTNAPSK